MPPARAIAIAISDSVTVSIAADANGTLSEIPRVNKDEVRPSCGCPCECRGLRRTASKVSTMSDLTRAGVTSGAGAPLMRESPLPASAGTAGFFDVDGRVVVAIAKGMALCGLGLEGGARRLAESFAQSATGRYRKLSRQ